MAVEDRYNDKNWDVYEEKLDRGPCSCRQGKILEINNVASHEKVPRIERDYLRTETTCTNPECDTFKQFKNK